MNEVAEYKLLDWDTRFFGFQTGLITGKNLSAKELDLILAEMKTAGFRLVYYPRLSLIENSVIIDRYKGLLADEKVTFVKTLPETVIPISDPQVISYTRPDISPELLELAWESGIYSRFHVDPNFKNNEYLHLYKTWIERSVSREIAKDILVYMDGPVVGGMITLGEKNGRGDIGLVAVSASSRGKGIGKKLMAAAEDAFYKMGYKQVQVVTQGINKPAMNLYEHSGYSLEERIYFYHFWL